MEAIQFEIVNTGLDKQVSYSGNKQQRENSLKKLILNSEHITDLFTTKKELQGIRFDELELLRDLRELTESEPKRFEKIKDPTIFRREIRSNILPRYLTKDFIDFTQKKLITELLNSQQVKKDQDALLTAMVFLQSHTEIGIPCEENPLWEIVFNLSLKDGIRFVDTLTAVNEGLDTLKLEDPSALSQEPFVLQYAREICEWPIFWKKLVSTSNIQPYEKVISAILRGEIVIQLHFDDVIHLPVYLHEIYSDVHKDTSGNDFIPMTDEERAVVAQRLLECIFTAMRKDVDTLIPAIKKSISNVKIKKSDLASELHQIENEIKNSDKEELLRHPIILTTLIAKISIKKYWENKQDYFFFFTIFKNPVESQHYYEFSQILLKLRKYGNIDHLLHAALELNSEIFWGYWGLGVYYLKRNDLGKSEINLNTALKIAQHLEIATPGIYRRELFLIKEDIRRLNVKKVKKEAKSHEQITLF